MIIANYLCITTSLIIFEAISIFMTYLLIFQAIQLEKETKEVKEEFQEFQEGSRELEAELETQLEQVNGRTNLI